MLIETIILLIPMIAGILQAVKKFDVIDDLTERFIDWITTKSSQTGQSDALASKVTRCTLVPVFSLFTTIHDLTRSIRDFGLRSGVRIASYLYLVAFLFVIFITVGYKVLLLALGVFALLIACVLLSKILPGHRTGVSGDSSQGFVEKIWPYFRSDSARAHVAGLFDVPQIDVDYTGTITTYHEGASQGKKVIGRVDQHGQIYDTRREAAVKLGSIDDLSRGTDERIASPL